MGIMAKAIWENTVLAESDQTIDVEGNQYFPPQAIKTDYFKPSDKPFMLNYRVHDLEALLAQLRKEGVEVDDKTQKSEFGYFGWIMDPEGNRIELWEPPSNK